MSGTGSMWPGSGRTGSATSRKLPGVGVSTGWTWLAC
jgi:hypothetical protein